MTPSLHLPGRKPGAPRKPEPTSIWSKLSRSDYVEIYRQGEVIAQGKIDMLALDGSVLWLNQDEGKGRVMFMQNEGLRIYKLPRADPIPSTPQ